LTILSLNKTTFSIPTEIHIRFDSLKTALHERIFDTSIVPINRNNGLTANDMNPELTQSHISWMKATTITQIIANNLDITHLIKLIPLEDRPKDQVNTTLPDTFSLSLSTDKTSVTNEQNIP